MDFSEFLEILLLVAVTTSQSSRLHNIAEEIMRKITMT